ALALDQDGRAAAVPGQPRREVERRRTTSVVREQPRQPPLKRAIAARRQIGLLELDQRRHQRLRHEAPAEATEVAVRVGQRLHRTAFASATNRRTLSGSFLPGRASTPAFASTACGRTISTARATFSGVSPPERITATRAASGAIAPIKRMLRHSIGSRVSPPSLHRAVLSNRMALATLRHHSELMRSPSLYSGSPSIVVAGDILTVLITGTEKSAQSSGFSSPCSWIARSRHASMMAFTWPDGWSQKTPTGVTNGGSQRTIDV